MTAKIAMALLMLASGLSAVFAHNAVTSRAVIGIDERLGHYIPEDMAFLEEDGAPVNLRNTIDKPRIIAPVLSCMHVCPLLLSGLAELLGRIDLVTPGKDFQVLTLSFDDKDTPAIARDKNSDYLEAIGRLLARRVMVSCALGEQLDIPDLRDSGEPDIWGGSGADRALAGCQRRNPYQRQVPRI